MCLTSFLATAVLARLSSTRLHHPSLSQVTRTFILHVCLAATALNYFYCLTSICAHLSKKGKAVVLKLASSPLTFHDYSRARRMSFIYLHFRLIALLYNRTTDLLSILVLLLSAGLDEKTLYRLVYMIGKTLVVNALKHSR